MRGEERVLLIGFGSMGQALVRGWLASGRAPATIRVVDTVPAALHAAASLGLIASPGLAQVNAAFHPAVTVLAVKPNQLAAVLEDCRARGTRGVVHLSIAAGKTLERLAAGLGDDAALVRAMPNTPAAIGKGITALIGNAAVTPEQRALCGELLAAVGSVVWLDDERHMDAVTAISGSGPAYLFLLVECLERAALDLGLAPALAKQLALATVAGASAYAERADVPPAELRKRVTSPNGTTQAALDVLMAERGGLAELLKQATEAAARRSRELSKA